MLGGGLHLIPSAEPTAILGRANSSRALVCRSTRQLRIHLGTRVRATCASQPYRSPQLRRDSYEDVSTQSVNYHVLKTHIDAIRLVQFYKERAHP